MSFERDRKLVEAPGLQSVGQEEKRKRKEKQQQG